jgi:hypothetical protein
VWARFRGEIGVPVNAISSMNDSKRVFPWVIARFREEILCTSKSCTEVCCNNRRHCATQGVSGGGMDSTQ